MGGHGSAYASRLQGVLHPPTGINGREMSVLKSRYNFGTFGGERKSGFSFLSETR